MATPVMHLCLAVFASGQHNVRGGLRAMEQKTPSIVFNGHACIHASTIRTVSLRCMISACNFICEIARVLTLQFHIPFPSTGATSPTAGLETAEELQKQNIETHPFPPTLKTMVSTVHTKVPAVTRGFHRFISWSEPCHERNPVCQFIPGKQPQP